MYCQIHLEKHKGVNRKALCIAALDKGITKREEFIHFCKIELDKAQLEKLKIESDDYGI